MLQSLFCAVLLSTVVTSQVGKYLLLVVISYNSYSSNRTRYTLNVFFSLQRLYIIIYCNMLYIIIYIDCMYCVLVLSTRVRDLRNLLEIESN